MSSKNVLSGARLSLGRNRGFKPQFGGYPPPTGTIVLINADDTGASATVPNADTNLATYSLAANNYSKILIVAAVQVAMAATSTVQTLTVKTKIGAANKSYTIRVIASAQDEGFMVALTSAQTAAATIAVSHGAPAADANTTTAVKNLYVYGVLT